MASGNAGAAPEALTPAVAVEQKPKKDSQGKGQKKLKGKGKGKTPWKQWDGPAGGGGFRLNVKNLAPGTSTGEQLRELFAQYGTVTDAQVKKKEDGTPQNFGFVVFASEQEARVAQNAMNGREMNGKPLKVAPAERRADAEDAGKGKGKATDIPPMDPMAMMMFQQMQMQQAMMSLMNPGLAMPGGLPGAPPGGLPGAISGFPGAGMPLPGLNPFLGAALPGIPGLPGMDGTYEGTLKSTSEKNGYGFIQCADTYAIHKRDVYVDKERLPAGIKVGEKVRFTMDINEKGQPRATFVQRV